MMRYFLYLLVFLCTIFVPGCQPTDGIINEEDTVPSESTSETDLSSWFGDYHYQQNILAKYITYDLKIYGSSDGVWASFRLAEVNNPVNMKLKVSGDEKNYAFLLGRFRWR